jgi:hypothetical protein
VVSTDQSGRVELGQQRAHLLKPRAAALRGRVHGFDNRGDIDARFLAIATPGVFGPAYFQDMAQIIAASGPPDIAAITGVMRRHGLTPARPAVSPA